MPETPLPLEVPRARGYLAWLISAWGLTIGASAALPSVRAAFIALDHIQGSLVDLGIYLDQAHRLLAPTPSLAPHWLYPPASALMWLGFAPLNPELARVCWGVIEALLCLWLAVHCAALMPSLARVQRTLCAGGLVLTSLPVVHCMKWGQVSVLITLLSVLGMQRAGWMGAALLGSAAALKLYPASYAAGYLARGQLRPVLQLMAAILALGLLLPLLILGPQISGMMIGRMLGALTGIAAMPSVDYQTLPILLAKWFGPSSALVEAPGPLLLSVPAWCLHAVSVAAGTACVAITWIVIRGRAPGPLDASDSVSVILCATLLIEPGWVHYFAVLPLGHAILIERLDARPRSIMLVAASFSLSAGALSACLIEPACFAFVRRAGVITVAALLCLVGLWFSTARRRSH
jgi:hypothetical protein